ncbi:PREDICTED: uncharacterized protein LOC101314974 [Fragaria vesca subsp. vesca]|uniref:uncharacterized protein LOC101314974 n=1 Tax=Fragaria vesca subsp. vesca TaxID=101020 RepID=UPI0002C2E1EA|nr:PREDICTED: uncharacterized protein LOC101314974 [Fragaria vesca subsp. vesca]XP_011466564.1 PREDICTED: uncharacterized protein LOC101314974 [Fragaria vesca subsp. vesca]
MGRKLREKQPSNATGSPGTGNNQGSCVWGMLHIMKYHHWHYVKKRLVYKKRGNNKNGAAAGVGNHGNCGDACSFQGIQDNDAKMDKTTTAEEKINPLSPTTKASVKARIKTRIAEEMAKRSRHNRTASCPVRSQLTRTESIHHFEPPLTIYPIAEMVLNEPSPRTVAHENKESSCFEEPSSSVNNNCAESSAMSVGHGDRTVDHVLVNENQNDEPFSQEQLDNEIVQDMLEKKLIHVKELDADSSGHQKEYLEALDIINVNKELLVKILQDPGSPLVQHFQNQQAVSARMSLTKAESFPMPGSLGKGGWEPEPTGKLKSKHEPKDVSPAPMPTWSTSLKYASERPVPSLSDHNEESSSSTSHPRLESQGENPVAIKRFKDLRQKIKHVIKESKQESRRMISMDAILHKIPHGKKLTKELEQEIVSHSKDPALHREGKDSPRSSYGSDHSVSLLKKTKLHHMRRTSSFDASHDRYRRLYETTSFNKEAKCHSSSERLQVRAEESGSPFQSSPFRKVPKSLGRIFSLPDMESYYQSEESPDGFPSQSLFKNFEDENASRKSRFSEQKTELSEVSETELQLDLPIESEVQENLDDATETNAVTRDKVESTSVVQDDTSSKVPTDEFEKLAAENSVSHTEQDSDQPHIQASTSVADPSPAYVPDINALQDISSPICSQSEGEELELKHEHGPDNLDNKQLKEPDIDTANEISSGLDTEEVETPRKHSHYDITHVQVDERDMIEFNYVKDVLELSGFNGNECLGTWHADDDPPVCPLVYVGVEGCFVLDPDCVENKEGGECDHLLLFDLINEVLMEISGRSYNYCPNALSSLCYIRLMPAGRRVLKEVWTLISWYLSLRPEFDQSLDYVVSNDLAKNDGWMNLQFDSECIGIELEDLLFDELLEEAIWE